MKKQFKKIPKFKSEKEEREFWQKVDSTEYIDYSQMENWQFPNLKLSTERVSFSLPKSWVDRIKLKAHRMDIPYQSLVKQLLFREFASA